VENSVAFVTERVRDFVEECLLLSLLIASHPWAVVCLDSLWQSDSPTDRTLDERRRREVTTLPQRGLQMGMDDG